MLNSNHDDFWSLMLTYKFQKNNFDNYTHMQIHKRFFLIIVETKNLNFHFNHFLKFNNKFSELYTLL